MYIKITPFGTLFLLRRHWESMRRAPAVIFPCVGRLVTATKDKECVAVSSEKLRIMVTALVLDVRMVAYILM